VIVQSVTRMFTSGVAMGWVKGKDSKGGSGRAEGRDGSTWIFVQRPRVPSNATDV